MKLELVNTDVCLPDYFSGDSRPWLCIGIPKGGILIRDLKAELLSELNQDAIGGNWYECASDEWYDAASAAINNLTPENKRTKKVYKDIDNDECYAYFVLINIEGDK